MSSSGKARARGIVVRYSDEKECAPPDLHEAVSRIHIARKLAELKCYDFADNYEAVKEYPGHVYFVPDHTLSDTESARRLGIHNEHDLFGGVVPHAFVATKTITHPLVDRDATAPAGWHADLGHDMRDAVLFGFSAFGPEDAQRAGRLVLQRARARIKPARGIGGRSQSVVSTATELDRVIGGLDSQELSRYGIVIEQNFDEIVTHSVGQVRVDELVGTYCGIQTLTKDNDAADVYGGSALLVVRGDYDALFELKLPPNVRAVITKARAYEAAVRKAFPDWIASRRNYDVAEVTDSDGRRRYGVLEQSWRIGGATPAEIAALQAFQADSTLEVVQASALQVYGKADAPRQAEVHFSGVDERVGPITKYTVVERYESAQ